MQAQTSFGTKHPSCRRETAVTKTPSALWKNTVQPPKTRAPMLPGLKDNILNIPTGGFWCLMASSAYWGLKSSASPCLIHVIGAALLINIFLEGLNKEQLAVSSLLWEFGLTSNRRVHEVTSVSLHWVVNDWFFKKNPFILSLVFSFLLKFIYIVFIFYFIDIRSFPEVHPTPDI